MYLGAIWYAKLLVPVLPVHIAQQPRTLQCIHETNMQAKLLIYVWQRCHFTSQHNEASDKCKCRCTITLDTLLSIHTTAVAVFLVLWGRHLSGLIRAKASSFRYLVVFRLTSVVWCSSRTAMIATVAASSVQYHHTVNTLKYADRAKEIKTHVRQNTGTVQEHIAQYQAIIDDLKDENNQLKEELNNLQV